VCRVLFCVCWAWMCLTESNPAGLEGQSRLARSAPCDPRLLQVADRLLCCAFFMLQGTCSTVEAHRAAAAKAAREVADVGQGQDASAAGGLYSLLDERHQSIVAPFLTTRFTQNASRTEGTGAPSP
jgi:hypothetical protein